MKIKDAIMCLFSINVFVKTSSGHLVYPLKSGVQKCQTFSLWAIGSHLPFVFFT